MLTSAAQPKLMADLCACRTTPVRMHAVLTLIQAGFYLLHEDPASAPTVLAQVPMRHTEGAPARDATLRVNPSFSALDPAALRDQCAALSTSHQRITMLHEMLCAGYACWRLPTLAAVEPANPVPNSDDRMPPPRISGDVLDFDPDDIAVLS
jgi:hypothetical protein